LKILRLPFIFLDEFILHVVWHAVEHCQRIVEYSFWGKCFLYPFHIFRFVDYRVDLGFLRCAALCLEVSFLATVEAHAWSWLLPRGVLHLCRIASHLPLPWGACVVARVHQDRHVVHPRGSVQQVDLSRRKALGLLISLRESGLVTPLERSEVGCVLRDRVYQLHRFDYGYHSFLHGFIGPWYWWGEYFVE
jgi:hypothetical protein